MGHGRLNVECTVRNLCLTVLLKSWRIFTHEGIQGGGGQRNLDPHGKSKVDIGFLRNTGTDPLEKHFDSFGFNYDFGPIALSGEISLYEIC